MFNNSSLRMPDSVDGAAFMTIIPFSRGAFEKGEDSTRFIRWEKYIRDVKLNIEINDIVAERQRLYFLAIAGPYIQELDEQLAVYDQSKDEDVNKDKKSSFEQLLWRLERHFKPKYNEAMEKVLFRQIKQEENEDIENFIVKLRNQAKRCKFSNEDDEIKTQIIVNCRSQKLREKLLEKDLELHEIVQIARLSEMKQRYFSEQDEKKEALNYSLQSQRKLESRSCFACGRTGHIAKSPECSAKNRTCRKCGKVGHFDKVCKTKTNSNRYNPYAKEMRAVTRDPDDDGNDKYIFAMSCKNDDVCVNIGGVETSLLIDTGRL